MRFHHFCHEADTALNQENNLHIKKKKKKILQKKPNKKVVDLIWKFLQTTCLEEQNAAVTRREAGNILTEAALLGFDSVREANGEDVNTAEKNWV